MTVRWQSQIPKGIKVTEQHIGQLEYYELIDRHKTTKMEKPRPKLTASTQTPPQIISFPTWQDLLIAAAVSQQLT